MSVALRFFLGSSDDQMKSFIRFMIYIYKGSGESGLRVYFLYPILDPTSKQVDRILLEHT